MGTMFGENNQEANELYELMKEIKEAYGLPYLIFYIGKCLEWLSEYYETS